MGHNYVSSYKIVHYLFIIVLLLSSLPFSQSSLLLYKISR